MPGISATCRSTPTIASAGPRSTDGQGDYDLGPGQPVLQNNFATTDQIVDAGDRHGAAAPARCRSAGRSRAAGTRTTSISSTRGCAAISAALDITVPVSDTLALEGGAGYENNRASQAAILTDADGNAILDSKRHLQADKSKTRLNSPTTRTG